MLKSLCCDTWDMSRDVERHSDTPHRSQDYCTSHTCTCERCQGQQVYPGTWNRSLAPLPCAQHVRPSTYSILSVAKHRFAYHPYVGQLPCRKLSTQVELDVASMLIHLTSTKTAGSPGKLMPSACSSNYKSNVLLGQERAWKLWAQVLNV